MMAMPMMAVMTTRMKQPARHKSLCMRKLEPSSQEKGSHRPSTQNDLLDHHDSNEDESDNNETPKNKKQHKKLHLLELRSK